MIKVDNSEVENLFKQLKYKSKSIYNKAIKNYTNKLAYETMQTGKKIVSRKFDFKSNATKNRSVKNVRYTKSKMTYGQWQSEVGSVGDIKGTTGKDIGAFWLGKQELGEKVKQVKYKKGVFRSELMTRVLSNKMKPKQVKQVGKSMIKAPFNNRAGLARGIRQAKKSGKKYVSTSWGIYQVKGGKFKPKTQNAFKIYSFRKQPVKLQKRKWLEPATRIVSRSYKKYAISQIDRAFKDSVKP